MKSIDDLSLLDKIQAGDPSACRTLVNRHKDYAFTVAYRILQNRENAEEAAQDAFMQAFRSLSSFNREAKFTTWFYRIVFNAALGMKRKQQIIVEDIETVHFVPTTDASAEEIKRREQRMYIEKALRQLIPDDATVLTLFYLKEHSLEEIAEITGVTVSNTKVRLHRARQRMAVEMDLLLKKEIKDLI